jgi:hypothetical protein
MGKFLTFLKNQVMKQPSYTMNRIRECIYHKTQRVIVLKNQESSTLYRY